MHRFLEHTSDELLEVKSPDFAEAFRELAEATFTLIGKGEGEEHSITIRASAEDLGALVVKLLEDLVVQCELTPLSPARAEVVNADPEKKEVELKVYGERKNPKNVIKAVTYGMLIAEKTEEGWHFQVLFDI